MNNNKIVPRYILLLSDLVKHTPTDHMDYDNLSIALTQMKESAEFINECKRLVDKVAVIQQNIVGDLEVT